MDKRLIIKFLQGKCTAEEEKAVVEWMHTTNFEPELLNHIEDDLIELETSANADEDLEPLLQNILIKDQIELIDSQRQVDILARHNRKPSRWLLRVAASLIILLSFAYLINFINRDRSVELASEIKHTVKQNTKGRRSTLMLPDGSVVKLNAASKIKYKEDFVDSSRVVYLEGEAFFEVVKDSLKPFIVRTNNISITALGTAFNVSSYDEEDRIAVALASGRVMVKDKDRPDKVFLEPGQLVQYQKKKSRFSELETFSAKSVYGWKDGILYFKSATLPEVISRLERWFGVEFVIEGDSPLSWSYTGEFDNQSLKSVLESLSFSQNFNYDIHGKTITVTFNTE